MDANTIQSRDPLERAIRKSCVTIALALFLDCVTSTQGGGEARGASACLLRVTHARGLGGITKETESSH